MSKHEPCAICEEYIEGVICNKDKCPVGIMKKENENLQAENKKLKALLKALDIKIEAKEGKNNA